MFTILTATLPQGVRADRLIFRQANFIETAVGNVETVLVEATVVVAVVLFAFLLNLRTTVILLTAIPVSILATAAVFHAAGLSIDTMTLGGLAIAIGELVDDAGVDVENIFRRLRENRAAAEPASVFAVVVSASQEVRSCAAAWPRSPASPTSRSRSRCRSRSWRSASTMPAPRSTACSRRRWWSS